MLEATLRDRARNLLTPSGRSDVPPFMVMDVMAAAARIEAAVRSAVTGGVRTADIAFGGPSVGTRAMSDAVIKAL